MQYTTNFSLKKPQLIEPASILDLNNNADSIDAILYQNRHISATDYNQNTSYVVGDIVIYENLLYKCTEATSGNWDSTKWSRTTLAAEVELAGQSGGSQVEGNPSGTATDQLEKISIDSDIYFINDASKVIANKYDSTSTYAVGDYCIYNTLLYKCITAVSTAETFDSNKWITCLVTNEMGSGGGGSANLHEVTQAQYSTLTEAQKKNGEMYFIKDVNGDGSQFQPVIYSTEEREVGVWTDGKPLYEKTFSVSNITVDSWQDITHNISNLSEVVKFGGDFQRNSDGVIFSIPYLEAGSVYITVQVSSTLIYYRVNGITTGKINITIQYTKTTDTPGSGTWTPQGVPAHHYSENEQVVGTWIDGSTVYERTFTLSERIQIHNNYSNILIADVSDYDIYNLIDCFSYDSNGGTDLTRIRLITKKIDFLISNNKLIANTSTNSEYAMTAFTIRYTKTTS